MASTSACRQNFHEEVELALNKQINLELYASHVYLTIVSIKHKHTLRTWNFPKCPLTPQGR